MEAIGQAGTAGISLLDIGIGIIFAMLAFSLAASAVNEAVATLLNLRGAFLRRGVVGLVRDEALCGALLDHHSIASLRVPATAMQRLARAVAFRGTPQDAQTPSAIPPALFARGLIETLVLRRDAIAERSGDDPATAIADAMEAVGREIDGLAADARLKARLRQVVAGLDLRAPDADEAVAAAAGRAETEIADWFQTGMEPVTALYLRRTRARLLAIGTLLAVAVNFDAVGYAARLAQEDVFRHAIISEAGTALERGAVGDLPLDIPVGQPVAGAPETAVDTGGSVVRTLAGLESKGVFIGWSAIAAAGPLDWLRLAAGWVLVGLACTLGGPFWFDLLAAILRFRAGAVGPVAGGANPRPSAADGGAGAAPAPAPALSGVRQGAGDAAAR